MRKADSSETFIDQQESRILQVITNRKTAMGNEPEIKKNT